MKRQNVLGLLYTTSVYGQILREVEKQPTWSMAHVDMNPTASLFLHSHQRTTEIYVITKGYGVLGRSGNIDTFSSVAPGSVFEISPNVHHMLQNKSAGHLEHLVFASPPFDSDDVCLQSQGLYNLYGRTLELSLPKAEECFDGAMIMPYAFPHLDLSITFDRVIKNQASYHKPHYHKKTTKWIYVVEGRALLKCGDKSGEIGPGDWIRIDPEEEHIISNRRPEDMVVVCVCSPAFQMEDVYYR